MAERDSKTTSVLRIVTTFIVCKWSRDKHAVYFRQWLKWRTKLITFGRLAIGSLSNSVFERRTSTGSEAFFLFICLDAIKFSLLTFFSLLKTIYPRVLIKPPPNDAKSPLPVDVCRSKTLLLKLPNFSPNRGPSFMCNLTRVLKTKYPEEYSNVDIIAGKDLNH